MKSKFHFNLVLIALLLSSSVKSQTPTFGSEIDVTINGLTFDAMEPFISPDGNTLFFNNLNDGVDTKLFYATKVNDSTFNLVGEIYGTNQVTQPYLDAVADMDSLNNFYWTSTRNYPTDLNNLFHGVYNAGNVTDSGRVYGDFNMNIPGWLVMDHGISIDGQFLYYNNARFDNNNCTGVCETNMGIAQKVNDSTFNSTANSSVIMQSINDPSYIFYAPCISSDHLELYYTRYLAGTITPSTQFDICVATRSTPTGVFSAPVLLFSELIADLIEGPTLTTDKQIIYYHKKTTNSHKIVMRHRTGTTGIALNEINNLHVAIYPNPMSDQTVVEFGNDDNYDIILLDNIGRKIRAYRSKGSSTVTINRESLNAGVYFIQIQSDSRVILNKKLIVQ